MMKNMRRKMFGCTIVLICFVAYSGVSHAARPNAPKSEVSPAIKSKVEGAVSVLAKKISRKVTLENKSAFALLTLHLGKNPDIYGAAFAFAPMKKTDKQLKSSPYVYRSGGNLIEKNLIDVYDYTVQNWYVLPVNGKKPLWSEPYYDEGGGNAWMITYSVPIYSQGKHPRLMGVLTSDVLIPDK